MITRRTLLTGTAAAGLRVGAGDLSVAQPFSGRPIKAILPYTASSPNDVIARLIATALSAGLGQPVVIENRAGGGTAIGLKAGMGADADGTTLLFTNTPTHVIAHLVSKGFTYDPLKDFAPIVTVGRTSLVLVGPAGLPANSLQDLLAAAYPKAHPGALNVGFGQGNLPHLVSETFKPATGTNIASIPYRGGAQAMSDMLGGRIHMNFGAGATLVPLIREGRIKALAATGPERDRDLPDRPTLIRGGLPALPTVPHYAFPGP